MITWLRNLLKPDPLREIRMVGTCCWKINYADIGETDEGYWQLWQDGYGKRSFCTTNLGRYALPEERLPGYGKMKNWADGGEWPNTAKQISKG